METKSRYEVISDLEDKKRALILERDSFEEQIMLKERELRNLQRTIDEKTENLEDYKKISEKRKTTIKELIESIDESLNRFSSVLQSQKK